MKPLGLDKRNKLCSAIAIDKLFKGEASKSAIAYPLRAVWRPADMRRHGDTTPKFLISIPKKRLRHAVDRVTMRRRVREAYRLNHSRIEATGATTPTDIAFIYVANGLKPYQSVEKAIIKLLTAIHSSPISSGNESSETDQPSV